MKNNKIPHCQDSSNRKKTKYHTVWTVPIEKQQNITLSGQFRFSIGSWNCPGCDILLFFMDVGTVMTVLYFVIFLLELS
jgi:hypothetical protein